MNPQYGSTICGMALLVGAAGLWLVNKPHRAGGLAWLCSALLVALAAVYYVQVDRRWTVALPFLGVAVALAVLSMLNRPSAGGVPETRELLTVDALQPKTLAEPSETGELLAGDAMQPKTLAEPVAHDSETRGLLSEN